jgi:RND family efflux transporter MFP subunit
MALGAVATAQQKNDATPAAAAARRNAPAQQIDRVEDGAPAPVVNTDERSFTKPSDERAFNFSAPGLVMKVNVKDGEAVKAGQVLAEQDVSIETANKATYEIEANSAVEEEYARADAELKKVELARKDELFKKKNATFLEVEEARLNVKRAEASVKLATQKRETARAQAAVEQAKIDLKRIISPIDGVVQKLDTHAGEIAASGGSEREKPAVRVVRNDPLWIDVNFPANQAQKLKPGQKLQVRYETEQDKWNTAEVLFLNPMVRTGSQTRIVRLVMPNPEDRPAGLEVYVKLPDAIAAAGREPQAGTDR